MSMLTMTAILLAKHCTCPVVEHIVPAPAVEWSGRHSRTMNSFMSLRDRLRDWPCSKDEKVLRIDIYRDAQKVNKQG